MEPEAVAPSSPSAAAPAAAHKKPGLVLILLVALVLIANLLLSFLVMVIGPGDSTIPPGSATHLGYLVGGTCSSVLVLPLVVVGLFQIGKRFRNTRSRLVVFLWTSVIVIVSHLGNIATFVQQAK